MKLQAENRKLKNDIFEKNQEQVIYKDKIKSTQIKNNVLAKSLQKMKKFDTKVQKEENIQILSKLSKQGLKTKKLNFKNILGTGSESSLVQDRR